jgi:hypothetical protein
MQDLIKKRLLSLHEEKVPGVSVTKKVQDEEEKVNKNAQKEIKKELDAYDQASGGKAKDDITPPKRDLTDDEEDTRQYVEKRGGMNDLEYDGEVGDQFKDRQEMAIAGDSKMGNKTYTGEENGNTEPVWGASDAEFGQKLIDQTKKSKELKDKATKPMVQFGDDIEMTDGKTRGQSRKVAVESKNDNKETIKESNKMKRLKFKKPFNGMEKAIELIPEHYKTDDKVFEMTDGNETYKVRWEGSLTEGKAVVLQGSNKMFVNEEMEKIKHLFNYKSSDTLGIVKGDARIDENKKFGDIWDKTKNLLTESDEDVTENEEVTEGEDINGGVNAPEKEAKDEKLSQAPEAKEGIVKEEEEVTETEEESK